MAITTETIKKYTMPCAVLRRIVAFPGIPMTIDMDKGPAKKILETAAKEGSPVFLVCQKNPLEDVTDIDDVYTVGVITKIKQVVKTQSGLFRAIIEPERRAVLTGFGDEKLQTANILEKLVIETGVELRSRALLREIKSIIAEFAKYAPKFSKEFWLLFDTIHDLGAACDFAAENLIPEPEDKQKILEEFSPCARAEKLIGMLEAEKSVMEERVRIKREVDERMKKNQRDYYLREQMKVIREELGEDEEEFDDDDIKEYTERLAKGGYPDYVKKALTKEIGRLSRVPFGSAENTVIRNYIEVCLDVPFAASTEERIDIPEVKKILDDDHEGLEKVKERIIEYLAALKLNPDLRGQIICLVGPPGTGKTSIATSIARATNRKFVRVSLGGVHDEAEIRGHRKTYIGSMPGRIINALIEAKSNNPLILLDEIDKMASDMRGDPASAMLEVLDREQNKTFRDNFVEIPVDLSNCMFITTANSLDTIARPLLDRMEIIELHAYTRAEKFAIARRHLIPKQMKKHGLLARMFKMDDESVYELIDCYTREAGVRGLERCIEKCCRRAAKIVSCGEKKSVRVTLKNLASFVGEQKMLRERISDENEIGIVNGMAWTELGGDLLRIEAMALPGTGHLELTGSLGDVMKESARAAISYIRSLSPALGIESDFYKTNDIHIHVPEGAVPKDGPSAGVTMVTALVSELCGIPVRRDVAMTGEITLHGRVMAIGGLREKTMAAYLAGVRTILIPKDNESDIAEIADEVKAAVEIKTVSSAKEALVIALERDPFERKRKKEGKYAQYTECRP
ncbi:MAG: endopeptidase La [Clostridiales bacterium]|nr:endopeptidase La [Clostridiales bacterium]